MLDNPIAVIAIVEIAVVLLFLIGCLLFFIRGQRNTVGALEEKILALRDSLKSARTEIKTARAQAAARADANPGNFGEMLDEQIIVTRNHHLSMNPDRDIVLDIGPDTPLDRRAVSLRHAFLIAEKEAWLAAEGKALDWDILSGKLAQIIQFYEQPAEPVPAQLPEAESDMFEALELEPEAPPEPGFELETAAPAVDSEELAMLRETVANQKRHIENLERFKALFFATDEKWRAASEQAEQYHQLLMEKSQTMGADADYQALLEKYGRVYDDFGASLAAENGAEQHKPTPVPVIEIDADEPSVGRMVIANQEEIQRLRNMAVDQHKMILRLRDELTAAQSAEDKDRVIAELHKQLERHERFLKESDLCTKQLENELDRMLNENHSLKIKLQDARLHATSAPVDANVDQMVKIIEDFTEQSSEMLNAIETLENECRELKAKLAASGAQNDSGELEAARQELAMAQQELVALQAQHVDLEERYLELKIKAG
jgi:hypothetical protein